MDLTQLANLGEFVGGVAVLVTLVYLAVQVRQTNRLTRTQVRQDAARMSNDLLMSLDEKDLELFATAELNPESLSPSALRYAETRFMALANYYEMLFYAHERGEMDDDLWEGRLQRMVNTFVPARDSLWPTLKGTVGGEFEAFVETTVLDMSTTNASWARR